MFITLAIQVEVTPEAYAFEHAPDHLNSLGQAELSAIVFDELRNGDHILDPEDVQGIILSEERGAAILQPDTFSAEAKHVDLGLFLQIANGDYEEEEEEEEEEDQQGLRISDSGD